MPTILPTQAPGVHPLTEGPRTHQDLVYRYLSTPTGPSLSSAHADNTHPSSETPTQTSDAEHRRYNQAITLPDGRQLGYADVGSPTGSPLFLFHGLPGSRLEARGLDALGRRHHLRIIAPDRPGYGLSTYHPTFRLVDWPADVRFLARALQVGSRFAVLGVSGGGPYALACAQAFPPARAEAEEEEEEEEVGVSSVGLLCSAGPWWKEEKKEAKAAAVVGYHDVPVAMRITSWAATNCPSLTRGAVDLVVGVARWWANTRIGRKRMDVAVAEAIQLETASTLAGKEMPQKKEHITVEAIAARRGWATRIFFEPFAQGANAFVQDACLISHPYGFPLEEVKHHVYAWHGTEDANSPIRRMRYIAERLPNCEWKEFEGDNHFSIMRHLEEVVTTLVRGDVSR